MSSKTKSIAELVTDLQQENEHLKNLSKLFNQACKTEFGYDVRELHQLITRIRAYEAQGKMEASTVRQAGGGRARQ